MTKVKRISFLTERVPVKVTGAYCFNGSRKMRWLQRLCLWVLERLGCQYCNNILKSTVFELPSGESILAQLQEDREMISRMMENDEDFYVVLGSSQMRNLAGELWEKYSYHFEASAKLSVYGMKCVVVPWIDGCFLLPKSKLEDQ